MQPIARLAGILETLAGPEHYLFSASDFYQVFPDMSPENLRVLLGRAVKAELLARLCRGIYLYPKSGYQKGFELYHAAARLRDGVFCYLSLESVLSEAGVISQIPLGWITLMTSGRSGIIDCGNWGHIEFIHTKKTPGQLVSFLAYDSRYRLFRASVPLALRDMRSAKRSMDLIDWDAACEALEDIDESV
jgi:hypothetical protein